MKTTPLILAASLLLSACSFSKKEIHHLDPLSPQEIRAVQVSLLTGRPLEQIQSEGADPSCQAPTFFAMNVKGSVTVPEDYDNPNGRQIQVYYYGRLQTGKDPVIFFNGGPASDSHSSAQLLEDFIRTPQAQKLSFLYMDQRGTGCSSPFPSEATAEGIERLSHYTSTEIVKDAEIIREKLLGAKSQWKIFGQSFGGLIVHRYALLAPHSIQGAFAHGFSLMQDQTEWIKLRVKSQKRVSELYFAQYPQDRTTLQRLRDLIPETLCFEDDGTQVCGPKMMDALTIFLGFSNTWSHMHHFITSILPGDQIDMSALKEFVRNYVFGVYNNNGLAGSVISLVEISSGDSDVDTCVTAQDRLKAEGETPEKWLINECRLLAGMQNDQWQDLLKGITRRLQMSPMQLKTSLIENPNLPFYLYSGEKDVFVPVETFTEEVQTLGSLLTYRQFPNTGHEGFMAEPQVWTDLLSVRSQVWH